MPRASWTPRLRGLETALAGFVTANRAALIGVSVSTQNPEFINLEYGREIDRVFTAAESSNLVLIGPGARPK